MFRLIKYNKISPASGLNLFMVIAFIGQILITALPAVSQAEPLDWAFATAGAKAVFSQISGRMGYNQQAGGNGTLNDLRLDLGLPGDNRTFEIDLTVRPLEHHLLRVFGRFPEVYNGSNVTSRELRTQNLPVYPPGTLLYSEMRTAMFGFGYDLDLMIGPRWYGGIHGELRYIDLKIKIANNLSGQDNVMQLDETTPCLGAHMTTRLPFGLDFVLPSSRFGGFARMTYGITPNFLNYMDMKMGLSLLGGKLSAPVIFDAQVGYEHESIFHNQENTSGRVLELKRDGIFVSLDIAY